MASVAGNKLARLREWLGLCLVTGWLAWLAPAIQVGAQPRAEQARAGSGLPAQVVLVVIDTLRADRLSALMAAGRAPYLASLAATSACLSGARASSSWTPTSTASLLSGLHPPQHGVMRGRLALDTERVAPFHRLPDALVTLPMVLQRAGFVTLGVSDNPHIDRAAGFARGFGRFVQLSYRGAPRVARTAERLVARAHRSLARPEPPTFLYLHFMDPHAPYHRRPRHYRGPGRSSPHPHPHPHPRARALAAYDSEIGYVDAALGRLHRSLEWDRDTLLIVTSDHGEAFGEHGSTGHPNHLYDELLRVPLLFHWPGHIAAGERPGPSALIDVLPSLRGILGLSSHPLDQGRDHSAALREGGSIAQARFLYAARDSQLGPDAQRRRSVTDGRHKRIWSSDPARIQDYDLLNDPGELDDLHARGRSSAAVASGLSQARARIERDLPRFRAPLQRGQADGALMRRLSALGYVVP